MKKALICMLQLHKASGSARTAIENIHYFKARGYEVHVAAMTMDKALLRKEGAILHKMCPWLKATGLTRRKWYNWQVQRLRKRLQPDVTVGHGDIQAQDVVTLHNCVFLASELIHGKPLPPEHEMAQTHGQIFTKQAFKKMIANSELMKADTVQRFNVPENKIHVIYPAVNTKQFYPQGDAERRALRSSYGFGQKLVVSLITSGNFKKRGLDIFIDALKLLAPEILAQIDPRVVGKDEPGPYRSELIKFDPGQSEIQNYYNAIDIFVLPARIEEFGRVVLEAMACGLPVITTDKVGASEVMAGESRRFVVPSHNARALADALTTLVSDADLRRRVGALNAQQALREAEDKVYEKFDRVFLDF